MNYTEMLEILKENVNDPEMWPEDVMLSCLDFLGEYFKSENIVYSNEMLKLLECINTFIALGKN